MTYNTLINFLIFFTFFTLSIFIDYVIINNYLGSKLKKLYTYFRNSSYIYIKVVLFVLFFTILYFFNISTFDIDFKDIFDISLSMADKNNGVNASVGTNATVNINNPTFTGTISERGINNIAAALSSAGGATAGLKTAQYVGGTPTTKLAVGLGTMIVVQATTGIMAKVLNRNNGYDTNGKGSNLVHNLIDSANNHSNNILNDYPLNLLIEVNLLLYAAILFLFVFFNIYLANYLSKINYSKYIPRGKIGNVLNTVITRYITVWNKSKGFLLVLSWILLFVSIILAKLCIHIIINHYN